MEIHLELEDESGEHGEVFGAFRESGTCSDAEDDALGGFPPEIGKKLVLAAVLEVADGLDAAAEILAELAAHAGGIAPAGFAFIDGVEQVEKVIKNVSRPPAAQSGTQLNWEMMRSLIMNPVK